MAVRRRRAAYRRKQQNKLALVMIIGVVLMLVVVLKIREADLKKQAAAYAKQEAQWESMIQSESERAEELEEFSRYTQTNKYKEEVARDKLGLVYDNQIIFEAGDD